MLNSIFIRTLFSRWKSTSIWSVSMGSFALLYTALFDSFSGQIEQLAASYPEGIQAFVGDIAGASTPEGWLGIELYSLFLPVVLSIIAIGFGAATIGKEEDSGTLELLLASPVSRGQILLEKTLAVLSSMGVVSLFTWLGVAVGSVLFPFEISLVHTFWATLMAFMLGATFGLLTIAAQALTGKRGLAIGVGSAFLAFSYVSDGISKLNETLEPLKDISLFYYYQGPEVLFSGLNIGNFLVFAAISIALYAGAYIGFTRRDTGV